MSRDPRHGHGTRTDRRHGDRAASLPGSAAPARSCPCAYRYGRSRSRPSRQAAARSTQCPQRRRHQTGGGCRLDQHPRAIGQFYRDGRNRNRGRCVRHFVDHDRRNQPRSHTLLPQCRPPFVNQAGRDIKTARHFRDRRSRGKRRFENPNTIILMPPAATFGTVQNCDLAHRVQL